MEISLPFAISFRDGMISKSYFTNIIQYSSISNRMPKLAMVNPSRNELFGVAKNSGH